MARFARFPKSQCQRRLIDHVTDRVAPLLVQNADMHGTDGRGPAVDQPHLQPGGGGGGM